jgi:hypothetical protein
MPIILKNINGYRRAEFITHDAAKQMVDDSEAVQAPGYPDIYEEVTQEERDQTYATRSMVALNPGEIKRKPGRPPKVRPSEVDEPPAAPVEE